MALRMPGWSGGIPGPRKLSAQMILLLLTTLFLSQIGAYWFLSDERRAALWAQEQRTVMERTAAVARLLAQTEPRLHHRIVEAASGADMRFFLAEESLAPPPTDNGNIARIREMRKRLAQTNIRDIRIAGNDARFHDRHRAEHATTRHFSAIFREAEDGAHHGETPMLAPNAPPLLAVSLLLPDGKWLNATRSPPPGQFLWALSGVAAIILSAVAVTLVTFLAVRGITRPVQALADGAEALGRGATPPPLPEKGAEEIRRAVRAFNVMSERLQRAARDRTAALAALSHDLRTPITILRLRAEFIEDAAIRARIVETLDEMEQMAESALSFMRAGTEGEMLRDTDLAALAGGVCADMQELGRAVKMIPGSAVIARCRPVAVKRALSNLVENAVKYGGSATLRLERRGDDAVIYVLDEGPGVPEDKIEKLFEPFFRLEQSRNRETGGMGMGLAIARLAARGHGGDVTLHNRPEGGLQAVLRLPV